MLKVNYYLHLILISRYKFLIILFVYLTLNTGLKNITIASCMMEGDVIPEIPETKEITQPSHQVVALKNEIASYAIPYAELQEQLDFYKQEVANLHEKNFHLERENEKLRNEIDTLETFPVNFY